MATRAMLLWFLENREHVVECVTGHWLADALAMGDDAAIDNLDDMSVALGITCLGTQH
jgi:hypothetical protein